MISREFQKMALLFTGCFVVVLTTAAALFLLIFDWTGGGTPYGLGQRPTLSENCREDRAPAARALEAVAVQPAATPAPFDEELKPLDPEQEELLYSENALTRAELIGLNEGLDRFDGVGQETAAQGPTPKATPAPAPPEPQRAMASAPPAPSPVKPEVQSEDLQSGSLSPPGHPTPSRRADLRRRDFIRFHWDPVPGAAAYRFEAWQYQGSKKVILKDARVDGTEIQLKPRFRDMVLWQVSAVNGAGNSGEPAGPIAIDVLTGN